jgi:hypothetical protein
MSQVSEAKWQAKARVLKDPKLVPYRDVLIDYDWPEGDQHFSWVATASATTLIKWAKGMREEMNNG